MKIFKVCFLLMLLFSFQSSFGQQIDFKDFVRADSNIINKNTVFNLYWSSVINKQLKFWHISEYKVIHKGDQADTLRINTVAFDKEGRIKRWNSVAFRYAGNGAYLGFVDTVKSMNVLPNVINNNAFTDYYYYSEKRDVQTNLLNNCKIISSLTSDTLDFVYSYNPQLYIKGGDKEINGTIFQIPDGYPCYLQSVKCLVNTDLKYERFLVYELYED